MKHRTFETNVAATLTIGVAAGVGQTPGGDVVQVLRDNGPVAAKLVDLAFL